MTDLCTFSNAIVFTFLSAVLDDHPDVDAIVIPVGGGGLIAGVALAAKTLKPSVQIIGVEPRNCASWQAALKAGAPTRISMSKAGTLADGLAVPEVGRNAFATCAAHDLVDEIVTVDEHAIALSILRLVEIEQVRVTQFFLVCGFLVVGVDSLFCLNMLVLLF